MCALPYPATLSVDYPDRPRNRLTVFFRIFTIIPIAIILSLISGASSDTADKSSNAWGAAGGIIFLAVVLMILFRQKYPRWWFDWNYALTRFINRFVSYLGLLRDEYPSTDEEQAVHLSLIYPDVKRDLNRWLPLVKWFLAIPHFIVVAILAAAAVICVIIAWFAILFTGKFPKGLFDFVVGVMRWGLRVQAYAILLITDQYPPFSLDA